MLVLEVSSEALSRSVFHTLAYADVFDYPLTAGEVHRYLTSATASPDEVLQALGDAERFARVGAFFTLRGREHIVEIRRRRGEIAARLWTHAIRYGRMIAILPFVRMVAVTGSLAMDNADEGKDIDFMIITEPGRLWTARALSLLIARFARLTGVNLCPNYLITTNALELQERSLYVAHEVAQMVPLSGMEIYRELRRANNWTSEYLPNAVDEPASSQSIEAVQQSLPIQKLLEFFFRLPSLALFEKWEMDRKIKRLTREQMSSIESYFSADVCKGHIDRHGENVVTALAVRLRQATSVATTKTL